MGYESKLYIVQKHDEFTKPWYEVLATIDLAKMGYDIFIGRAFRNLFTIPQDGDMYGDDGNTNITEDCYGDPVEGALIDDVIDWLKEFTANNDYRRANVCLDLLLSFRRQPWDAPLLCFHYGY